MYGTDPTRDDGAAFSVLVSRDLRSWRPADPVLAVDPAVATATAPTPLGP